MNSELSVTEIPRRGLREVEPGRILSFSHIPKTARDPIGRYLSHYQHQFSSGRQSFRLSLEEWVEQFVRQNWMVRMRAGEEELRAAQQILTEKLRFVGVLERFDESLLLLRSLLDLDGFEVDYMRPMNQALLDQGQGPGPGELGEARV